MADSCELGRPLERLGGGVGDGLDEVVVVRDLDGGPRECGGGRGVEAGSAVRQRVRRASTSAWGLAGQGAALDRQNAAVGDGRFFPAAGDETAVDEAAAQPGVLTGAELLIQVGEGDQDGPGLEDGVLAEVRPGAVGGDADDVDLGPDEAAVGGGDGEFGGFGDDRCIGVQVPQHFLDAEAGVFFVGDGGGADSTWEVEAVGFAAGDEGA